MRVLVTGHAGYIGSVLVDVLRHSRYDVVGLDCNFYQGCEFGRVREAVPSFDVDIRDIEFTDLLSFDTVIHLAALPEAALVDTGLSLAQEMDEEATIRLAHCCRQAGVSRFVYASTCSVFGRAGGTPVDESARANPVTAHARSKLRCESALRLMAGASFSPVILRHANVYGASPRLRLDLIVNNFVASAITSSRVTLRSDGRAWRPVIHVEDLCRAYAAVLSARDEDVRGEVFNVACSEENYRVIDMADLVTELVPHATRCSGRFVPGEQSYRVDGSKFAQAFPKFAFRWTLPEGIRQMRQSMSGSGLTPSEWRSDRYRRAMRLASMIERNRVGPDLREPKYAVA